jgi:hypothetical protein
MAQPEKPAVRNWLDSPYPLQIRTSLVMGVTVGFSLGLYLLLGFAFGLRISAGAPALVKVHGQVQIFGFLALFIIAVAVQLFPRFHATPLHRPAQVSAGGLLLSAGVTVRAIAQPLPGDASVRSGTLLLSSVLTLVGVILVVHAFAGVIRAGLKPATGWVLCCRRRWL